LSSIQKIIRIDQSDYIKDIKLKLSKLINERNAIDVDLDESEMMELLKALKKIVSLEHKKVASPGVDQVLNQEIAPLVEKNTSNYFHKKFYAQENRGGVEELGRQAVLGIRQGNGAQVGRGGDSGAGQGKLLIDRSDFYDLSVQARVFSHYCVKTKELTVVELDDTANPHVTERKISARAFKIDSRSAHTQLKNGSVVFTGGWDETSNRAHSSVESCNPVLQIRHHREQTESDSRHELSQVFPQYLPGSRHSVCLRGQARDFAA